MTDITPFLADAATAELEDLGPLEEATGEPMRTTGLTLWQDGEQEVGVWECTPGPSYWKLETHEFVLHPVRPDDSDPGRRPAAATSARARRRSSRAAGQAPGRSTRRSARYT